MEKLNEVDQAKKTNEQGAKNEKSKNWSASTFTIDV